MESKDLEKILEQYKYVPLRFTHYYKYAFTFTGTAPDGKTISATYGGVGDDVYRCEVCTETPVYIGDDYEDNWESINISDGNQQICRWVTSGY